MRAGHSWVTMELSHQMHAIKLPFLPGGPISVMGTCLTAHQVHCQQCKNTKGRVGRQGWDVTFAGSEGSLHCCNPLVWVFVMGGDTREAFVCYFLHSVLFCSLFLFSFRPFHCLCPLNFPCFTPSAVRGTIPNVDADVWGMRGGLRPVSSEHSTAPAV